MKKFLKRAALVVAVLFVLIQLVPYGRSHANPPVKKEPAWDSSQTRALAVRACFDCHSNESNWPWYSHIAPFSCDDAAEELEEGEMPPWFYLPLHPEAQLSDLETAQLLAGLKKTFPDSGGDEHDDD
jgi:hypothetical protein